MSQFVLFITITLKPGTQEAFMPQIEKNAATSEQDEPGCQKFEVLLPHDGTQNVVYLYEVYDDEAAFATHQAMAHYIQFKDVANDMIENMDVIKMKGL